VHAAVGEGHTRQRLAALIGAGVRSRREAGEAYDHNDGRFRSFLRRTFMGRREELLYFAFFDGARRYLGDYFISGGDRAIDFRGRQLFSRAFAYDAAAVLMVHNHPSGSPLPSQVDLESTERLVHVGQALDIELLDHLIVGGGSIYSMKLARIL
jgi:DNA repair protein RadC